MDSLVGLDGGELLNGNVRGREARSEEVSRLEFGQRLRIELCLETFEGTSEF